MKCLTFSPSEFFRNECEQTISSRLEQRGLSVSRLASRRLCSGRQRLAARLATLCRRSVAAKMSRASFTTCKRRKSTFRNNLIPLTFHSHQLYDYYNNEH